MKKIFMIAAFAVIFAIPVVLNAWPSYKSLSTPYFRVFYRPGWESQALNLLQTMEQNRPFVEELTGNRLDRISYVIEDMGNMVNGYASPVGIKIAVFAYPPSGDELSNGESWWQLVGVHEYIHMAQMTKISGEPSIIRALFGNIFYPNLYQPNWMTEAITVYGESAMSPYSGRMNGGTYPAIISALAAEGNLPSITKAGYYSSGTPLANHYVFGGSFYKYLAEKYGQDKFPVLFEYTGSSLFSYLNPLYSNLSLDQAYKEAYGKPLQDLWRDWQTHERSRDIKLPNFPVTNKGWNISNLKYHDGALYFTCFSRDKTGPFSGFNSNRLIRIRDPKGEAKEEVIVDQATEFPAGFQILGNNLYYSRQEMSTGFDNNEFDGWGVITQIWKKNLDTGATEKIASGPIRSFTVRKDGSILIAEDNRTHQSSLISSIDPASKTRRQVANLNYLIASMLEYQGKLYVSAKAYYRNNSIFELDLETRKMTPIVDTPFGENIVDIRDGKIYYESLYDYNNGCYAYDLASRTVTRIGDFTEIKSLALAPDGSSYFISMNSRGQDVYRDQLRSYPFTLPSVKSAAPPRALEYPKDDMVQDRYPVEKGGYLANIGHLLWPRLYRFPYVAGTEDSLQVGVMMAGQDILGDFPYWDAMVIWDSYSSDIAFQVNLENSFFRPIQQSLSFSTLKGNSFQANQYIQLLSRMNYGLSGVWTGFGLATSEGLDRKLWYPYLGTSFRWPGGSMSATNQLMYETQDFWASDRERLGWQARANLKQKLSRSSELRSRVHLAWDPDADPDEVFSNIRGYDSDWLQTKGAVWQNSIYTPLIRIREGIWNPNIYLEDIAAGLFFDASIPSNRDESLTRWSAGMELIAELNAGYMFSLDLGFRLSYNKDKQITPSLILGTEF